MRAKYLALDRRRQLQRRQILTGVAGTAEGRPAGPPEAFPAFSGAEGHGAEESVDSILEQREQQQQLREVLATLPELDRLLVYLRYFRLATTEEIAARTGLTRRAIDTRLWRARKALREALEALEERTDGHVRAL
jgi:RNA polymerase sigma factor (sigma-70 family)